MDFNPTHLKAFEDSLEHKLNPDDTGGKLAKVFGQPFPDVQEDRLHNGTLSREAVFALVENQSVNTSTVSAAILAWGGMRPNHRDLLLKDQQKRWLNVAESIRRGKFRRDCAYNEFDKMRQAKPPLKGMGPAYFTKLIYFLLPRGNFEKRHGYIMDQWASCSINLLLGRNVVLMNISREWQRKPLKITDAFTVSNVNTHQNYEEFCSAIDVLASMYNRSPEEIDRALLGTGGRKPQNWREHVIKHRQQIYSDALLNDRIAPEIVACDPTPAC